GTRISEESGIKPKPMVEIGGMPILWHIMKIYSHWGIHDFVICCGYKGYVIKEYFANYFLHQSDVTFDLNLNQMVYLNNKAEPWKVTLVDTGQNSMTGGRLRRVKEHVQNDTFCMTYGDGVSNVDISELIKFHRANKVTATLTAVQEEGRFGTFTLGSKQAKINSFREKPKDSNSAWINGGFFVLEPEIFDYLEGDSTVFERGPLEKLAKSENLAAFRHDDFWMPMDTLRDKNVLEDFWASGKAPWKVWE
ncbi:MAG: glucose-1-phosphate cytidylyltransferase, partial [Cytophagales bacterium]|nr:glucose-1-phosphate cytidylyltransferase [Cytophagales bacterium]